MSKKTKNTILALVALLALVIVAAGAFILTRPETAKGSKSITFTVVDNNSKETEYKIKTDEEYLAKALENEGYIVYDASGLYNTICGITADYNADGAWWAIYSGGEMASVGMNELPIVDGGEYEAVYTKGFAS